MPKKTTDPLAALHGYPNIPAPGDIYDARLEYQLADGNWFVDFQPVMLYDVRPVDPSADWRPEAGQPIRILWTRATKLPEGWMPGLRKGASGSKHMSLTTTSGLDMSAETDKLGVQITSTAIRISLRERVGTYKPLDPKYNSLDIIRDAAITEVSQRMNRDGDLTEAVAELDAAETERNRAEAERAARIRGAIARNVSVAEIARITRLSIPRIYQIRDGRR